MLKEIRPALAALAVLTVVLGLAYPLAMTGLAQAVASGPANGGLVRVNGRVVGSSLIGQVFTSDKYLHGRPSAAGDGYDPTQSGGSNLGPLDPKLSDRIAASAKALGGDRRLIPADAVTTSGSGLDPDISPEFAQLQAPRIAAARHASLADVQALLQSETKGRLLGVIGEPRLNVLAVNVALDQRWPVAASRS